MSYPEILKHPFKTGVQGAVPPAGMRGVPAKTLFTSSTRRRRRRVEEVGRIAKSSMLLAIRLGSYSNGIEREGRKIRGNSCCCIGIPLDNSLLSYRADAHCLWGVVVHRSSC